ncbi:hypothetical protein V6R21_07205 [Limibacter armeniacum]|uniref:pirin family protein n=1 Tax=Limibacter armeniacum TaxID=466084 RepID=UPI002FE69CFA
MHKVSQNTGYRIYPSASWCVTQYQNQYKELYMTLPEGTFISAVSYHILKYGYGKRVGADKPVLVMPIVGGLEVKSSAKGTTFITAGNLIYLEDPRHLYNPYEDKWVSFFLLELASPLEMRSGSVVDFDLDRNLNKLITPLEGVSMGLFEGRKHGSFENEKEQSVYVYVIEGVFEVEDRLLETGDGLFVEQADCLTFESLSSNAIILFTRGS